MHFTQIGGMGSRVVRFHLCSGYEKGQQGAVRQGEGCLYFNQGVCVWLRGESDACPYKLWWTLTPHIVLQFLLQTGQNPHFLCLVPPENKKASVFICCQSDARPKIIANHIYHDGRARVSWCFEYRVSVYPNEAFLVFVFFKTLAASSAFIAWCCHVASRRHTQHTVFSFWEDHLVLKGNSRAVIKKELLIAPKSKQHSSREAEFSTRRELCANVLQ